MRALFSTSRTLRATAAVATFVATAGFALPTATHAAVFPLRVDTSTAVKRDTANAKRVKAKAPSFAAQQQNNARVLDARLAKRFDLRKTFSDVGLEYPAAEIFIRIFKRERTLEVWGRAQNSAQFVLVKAYPICAMAGQLGPKQAQGDGQTPEGFYYIDGFNPSSDFHLSLHIDYPNRADQTLGKGKNLGGDIYIHGGCKTEGCLAVNDDAIKELYWLAVESRNVGQQRIPVHIFPARLTDDELYRLTKVFDERPDYTRFWANLKPTYDFFETTRQLPQVNIDERGRYRLTDPSLVAKEAPAPKTS